MLAVLGLILVCKLIFILEWVINYVFLYVVGQLIMENVSVNILMFLP